MIEVNTLFKSVVRLHYNYVISVPLMSLTGRTFLSR